MLHKMLQDHQLAKGTHSSVKCFCSCMIDFEMFCRNAEKQTDSLEIGSSRLQDMKRVHLIIFVFMIFICYLIIAKSRLKMVN